MLSGKLEIFMETGTEGPILSFYDETKTGYDGLHSLRRGAFIKVFNKDKTSILYEGGFPVDERGYGVLDEDWVSWFTSEYPAEYDQEVILEPTYSPTIHKMGNFFIDIQTTYGVLNLRENGIHMYEMVESEFGKEYNRRQYTKGCSWETLFKLLKEHLHK